MTHPSDGAIVKTLIEREKIEERVRQLGADIRRDYGDEEITLLCILKGSFIFTADLARAIDGKVCIEFLGVQSYGDHTESTGIVQITHDLTKPIEGKHVLLVEDIVDTGLTVKYLVEVLSARKPASLKVCALLERPTSSSNVRADYVGFPLGPGFVVGYGLDWAQRFRNLPYLGIVDA